LDERLGSLSAEELRDLGDHYAAIAGAAARLAALRSLPGDVRRLRRSLAEMAATEAGAGMCRLDGRLHLEVAAASQSGRLTREEIRLQAEIGPLVWPVHDLPDRRGRVDAEHAGIVDAIEAADDARARDVAESHV